MLNELKKQVKIHKYNIDCTLKLFKDRKYNCSDVLVRLFDDINRFDTQISKIKEQFTNNK